MISSLVILIVAISAPFCECQNATGNMHLMENGRSLPNASSSSLTLNNQVSAGSTMVSIASLTNILAGIISETRRPVVNTFHGHVTIDNHDSLSAFEKHHFSSSFGLGLKLKNEVVGKLNNFRKKANGRNMNCLLWSEKLAARAAIKAKTCTYDNKNKASIMSMVFEKDIGDNLVERSVRRWKEDKSSFHYGLDCRHTGGCQYQQIVWAKSKEVGCAVERCANMSFLVCLFDPPGNVRNKLPYLTGDPCTQCSAPQGSIPRCNKDNLCEWNFSKTV